MDAGRHQVLVMLGDVLRHLPQVENEVADMTEKLVLVDIPGKMLSSGTGVVTLSWSGTYHSCPFPPGIYTSVSMSAIPTKSLLPRIVGRLFALPTNCV